MESSARIDFLIEYIRNTVLDKNQYEARITYNHMSAIIVDSILQSGVRYDTVVSPRVNFLISNYSSYTTTSQFILLYNVIPLAKLINWKNEIKIERIISLSNFFFSQDVETASDLYSWMSVEKNNSILRDINGIGPKTLDYIKMLVGYNTIPIDRHLFNFAKQIGIIKGDYDEISALYHLLSYELDISPEKLDFALWNYLKSNKEWKLDLAYQLSFV